MIKEKLLDTIEQISREKGIDKEVLINAIEEALKAASAKYFGEGEIIETHFDRETGEVKVLVRKKVVERLENPAKEIHIEQAKKMFGDVKVGDEVEIPLPAETLGRIAAQAAKSVILSKVREAERQRIYNEYKDRVGQVVTGTAHRIVDGDVFILIGKDEAVLPVREQIPGEVIKPGDMVKGLIVKVLREERPAQIIISRNRKEFVLKLLETEIPEIAEGVVKVMKIVREPGVRTKIAVYSEHRDVDPVGSCIGLKGNRVLAVTKQLNGERIDIIQWSSNPVEYIKNALSPARVSKVTVLDERRRIAEVVVPDDQYSIAIGKKGANIKLASRLVGWRIEMKTESQKRNELISMLNESLPFDEFPKPLALYLKKRKIRTWKELSKLGEKELLSVGISKKFLNRIREELDIRGYKLRR